MRMKELKDLDLTSDFVFFKVMQNPKLCKRLLEVILGVEIERIEYPENQKTLQAKYDTHGIRLDVYVKDGKGTVYNVEMQALNPGNLPKRSRYYQGMMDISQLQRGSDYGKLNRSYVIFICLQDIFGEGRAIYTFENRCVEDLDVSLGDGTTKIFLNPCADLDGLRPELANFLQFLRNGRPVDEFTERLVEEVETVKNNKWLEFEYKSFYAKQQDVYEEGKEEGIIQTVKRLKGTLETAAQELAAQCGMSPEEALETARKYW